MEVDAGTGSSPLLGSDDTDIQRNAVAGLRMQRQMDNLDMGSSLVGTGKVGKLRDIRKSGTLHVDSSWNWGSAADLRNDGLHTEDVDLEAVDTEQTDKVAFGLPRSIGG